MYFIWGTIPYGVIGIDILTADFTISCVLFNSIIFGYHLLATEDVKTNTTPGVRKTASKNSMPRQAYGKLPRRTRCHARRMEDCRKDNDAAQDVKTTNTTPGVRKTASKNSMPRQAYGRLPRRTRCHARRMEDCLEVRS